VQRKDVLYTRFSTDMQRDECCEDQEREVRKGLALKGIDATNFMVVHDRAASGTKNDRAQFEQLRARIQRGDIGILAVDDQARVSRADDAYCFITDLVFSGGRFISTGEGIDTAQEGWELRVKVMELHNSTTIRELGRRVRRGQLGRVLDDGSAGDYPFGYESYYLDPNWIEASRRGPKPKKGVRILEVEAGWVRQVFAWFADEERSIGWIARELTRHGVSKGNKATTPGWHHQQVHRMLENQKYVGFWLWGATKTLRGSQGKTKQVRVPDDQRIVRQRPALRIIDQATWDKAERRLGELKRVFGQRPGQKPRGPKVHHSQLYPQSLLGGLLFCHSCGARLWFQGGGGEAKFNCPNHRKGSCAMASLLSASKAEATILGLVSELLSAWPDWLQAATDAMRHAVNEFADQIPKSLQTDERRLAELESQIEHLVDQLAGGTAESPALRRRLDKYEQEFEVLRVRVEEGRRARETAIEMPDDGWIRTQLAELPPLLVDDLDRTPRLLRRLFGRVTAEAILAPGKQRGFMRLHLCVEPLKVLKEALQEKLPESVFAAAGSEASVSSIKYQLDLGKPTRFDDLAPEIVALRDQSVTWPEIGRVTGVGTGNAYNIWKRWSDAQLTRSTDRA